MAKLKKEVKPTKKHDKKNDKKQNLKKKKRDEPKEQALKFAAKNTNLKTEAIVKTKGPKLSKSVKPKKSKSASDVKAESNKKMKPFNNAKTTNAKVALEVNKQKPTTSPKTRKQKKENKNQTDTNVSKNRTMSTRSKFDKAQKPMKAEETVLLNSVNNTPNGKNKKRNKKKQAKENKIEKLKVIKEKKEKQVKGGQNELNKKKHQQDMENAKTRKHSKLNIKRLEKILLTQVEDNKKEKQVTKQETLRDRMMAKLKSSRFRYLNENLYNSQSKDAKEYFKGDPDAFTAYHEGYSQQVKRWPFNPLDKIVASIKKLPKDFIIADFGCGDAKLAASVPQKCHSFDFISLNDRVTACDMAHTSLLTSGVNVVVFCLSLMGTNLNEYLIEANRVLKKDGILKIAEVESRFDKIDNFINDLKNYGFKLTLKDLSHNLFYFMDFKKTKDITRGYKSKLPAITLKPCLYKKR